MPKVIHDNHKAECENNLRPAYHLLEKMKLLSKPVFKNFISNKVQNAVWIAIFMQLFLAALDKIIFRDYNYNNVIYHCYIGGVQN